MSDKDKVIKFKQALDDQNELFFSTGSVKEDLKIINGVLKRQGYWAGEYDRIYFNDNYDVIKVEPRIFGA